MIRRSKVWSILTTRAAGNHWMRVFDRRWHSRARLADNENVKINVRTQVRIAVELCFDGRRGVDNDLAGVDNILEQLARRSHNANASRRTLARKRGRMPSSSTTSTFTPSKSRRSPSSPA